MALSRRRIPVQNHRRGLAGPEGATVSITPGGPLAPTKGAKCSGPLRFVSDYNNGLVDVYRRTILCRVVYGFANPNGIAIDAKGALYVTEKGNSTIAIVKPPYAGVTSTLSDSGQDPAGIAFCSGYIAVTNLETNQGGAGSVSIYLNGATSPSYILQDANAVGEYAPACDSGGNLYTSYRNATGSGSVNEWIRGTGNPIELTAISTGFPGGLRYQKGNLWVGDQQTPTVSVWPPPFDHSTKSVYLQGSDDPVDFIVDSSSHGVIVADALLNEDYLHSQGQETATLPGNGGGLAVGIAVEYLNTPSFLRVISSAAAACMLVSCDGTQTSTIPASGRALARNARLLDVAPSKENKIFSTFSDDGNYRVYVYTYPGAKLVGTLDTAYGSPAGMCVGKAGHIFVAEYNYNEILEYAHGGQVPINTLTQLWPAAWLFD